MTARRALVSVTGDATNPLGHGPRIIAHVCNDVGGWGRGFVLAVSGRWDKPEREYRQWWRTRPGRRLPLGEVQFVEVGHDLWVANMVAQRDIRLGPDGRPPIRYDALAECLRKVADTAIAVTASVHMPRIGCGLAGGRWDEVKDIIVKELCVRGVPVTVYDLTAAGEGSGR